ncbi:MAG: tRNA 2-thiouridine(34) synthase MnmA, partial [Alphaproteobacteria bacterium]|nr:tRNA 2-thiouridine(34) synthase MnmA [Alphaproteobacteria bacterium]
QRRGIGVSSPEPLYVVKVDAVNKQVIVGPKEALFEDRLRVRQLNWLGGASVPAEGAPVSVKLRSAQKAVPATLYGSEGGFADIVLHEPQSAITPGQACVMYDGERMLGGGWIMRKAS